MVLKMLAHWVQNGPITNSKSIFSTHFGRTPLNKAQVKTCLCCQVSPLQKHCAWNKYGSRSRSTVTTGRQIDQVKIKVNPIERFSAAYKTTPQKKWEIQHQGNNAANRRISKSYDVGIRKRHSVWSTVNQET